MTDARKPVRVALCGCGAIARAHALVLKALEGVCLRAYCDILPGRAGQFLAEFGGEYATTDIARLAEDPGLDAVYINTLHHCRLELLRPLAEAGKAVFMEKPLTHDLATLLEMGRLLAKHPIVFQSGYKLRFHSLVGRARSLLPAPELIVAHVLDETWPENHLNDPAIVGGNLRAQGVYAAEILHVLAGSRPVAVTGMVTRRRHASGVEDTLGAVYEFANGTIGVAAVADAGLAVDGLSKFLAEAAGANGSFAILDRFQRLEWRPAGGPNQTITGEEDGFRRQSEAFLASVRDGAPVQCDFREGTIPSLMIYRALDAAAAGRKLDITSPWDI